MPSELPVTVALYRLGGQASWRELGEVVSRRRLDRALAAGDVVRLARGRYGLPDLPDATSVAARVGGVVSHLSAAQHHRLSLLSPPAQSFVTVRANAHPDIPHGVRVFWRTLGSHDVDGRVTTALRTVLDCAADLSFPEALAVADQALKFGLVTADALSAAALAWAGRRRSAVLTVARHADGRAAGPFESALRALAVEAGCHDFEPQVKIRAGRRRFRVDLADRRRRIVLEADSFEWHGDRKALRRDCRRYDELVRAGWVVLRFAWEDVMGDPGWVAAVIRDVVRARREECQRSCCVTRARRQRHSSPSERLGAQNSTVANEPTRRKPTRSYAATARRL
ncbi:MAG: DUF559 domain-containing protein [Actinomycetota bacterium]